jgi:hypothetical protein
MASFCPVFANTHLLQFEQWSDEREKRRGAEYEALKAALSQQLIDVMLREFPQVRP